MAIRNKTIHSSERVVKYQSSNNVRLDEYYLIRDLSFSFEGAITKLIHIDTSQEITPRPLINSTKTLSRKLRK